MFYSGISLVTPLIEARNARLIGGKAARLARLPSGSYMVPKGFVVSADAYRLHVWKSGAKTTSISNSNPDIRDNVRQVILDSPIPLEVTEAITEAYQTLGMHVGYQSPLVIVRPSVIEKESAVRPERKVYEHKGPVTGIPELLDAIKVVWASLWSDAACSRRIQTEDDADPAMAVVIQDFIKCTLTGEIRTADVISGRPNVVRLLFSNPNNPKERHTAVFKLDSLDFEDCLVDHETMHILNAAVDKGIMLESILGDSTYTEWGWDGKWIWLFQADPLGPAPVGFPKVEHNVSCPYQLISRTPLPILCRPTSSRSCDATTKLLSAAGITDDVIVVGGHLYRPIVGTHLSDKFEHIAASSLPKAEEVVKESLSDLAVEQLTNIELAQEVADSLTYLRGLQQWMTTATITAYALRDRFKELVGLKCTRELLCDLLCGINNPFSLRDAEIQDFGARLREAQERGDAESVEWWNPFKTEVEEFSRENIYSFTSPVEYYDLSLWNSWNEDTQQVFRLIKANTPRIDRPSIPVLHTAAEEARAQALGAVCFTLDCSESKKVAALLEFTRSWIRIRYELEHKAARTAARQRDILKEAWLRIADQGSSGQWLDIFELDLGMISDALIKPIDESRSMLTPILAKAKHSRWLEARILPPNFIGMEMENEQHYHSDTRKPILGKESIGAQVRNNARLIETYEQVSELRPNDIALLRYPALAWSAAICICSGIVTENIPDVPPESWICTEYRIPAVYGCANVVQALSGSKRVIIDGSAGYAKSL